MKAMQGLLDINEYFVRELIIKENPAYKSKKLHEGKTKISYGIKRKDAGLDFMIDMNVQVGESRKLSKANPYYISIKLTGLFRFIKKTDENIIAKMINYNGLSILYGIARGIAAQATANCMYGKYVLPTINFIELIKRQSTKKSPKKKSKKKS